MEIDSFSEILNLSFCGDWVGAKLPHQIEMYQQGIYLVASNLFPPFQYLCIIMVRTT